MTLKRSETKTGGRNWLLPQDGFVVKGPRIGPSLVLVNGQPERTVYGAETM